MAACRGIGGRRVHRLVNLYHLILFTGMRRGEAIDLRWEDVDLEGRCLSVVEQITEVHGQGVVGTPKAKRRTRLIPIDDETVAILRRHQEMQDVERAAWGPAWNDAGLVFTREDGRPLRPEFAPPFPGASPTVRSARHSAARPETHQCQPGTGSRGGDEGGLRPART